MMKKKLGIIGIEANDESLIIELLAWMHENKADYTNTFCYLMDELLISDQIYTNHQFITWKQKWEKRTKANNNTPENSIKLMRNANPLVIPRNYKVEEALKAATDNNDLTEVKKLIKILENPYDKISNISTYQSPPISSEKKYKTYCGT